MEFLFSHKKNEVSSFAGKWMELENIILSEVSPGSESQRLHVFSHVRNINLIQIQEIL
jgi:hypothetical protein